MWTWRRKPLSEPQSPVTLPVTRAEWRSLPPIQRVVAEHPLINPVQRFSSSLTSWRSPAYLEPLGHRVGPAEPAGVIGGLAHPRTAEPRVPDMPVVQRSARKRGVLSRLWGMSVQRTAGPATPAPESLVPEQESVSSVAAEEPSPAEPGPVFEPTATFVLPAVAAATREPDRPPMPLTSAGLSAASARPPVRTVQAIRSEAPAPPRTPVPSVEPAPMYAEPPLAGTPQTERGPIASEPDLADAEPFETRPFETESFETVPVKAPDPVPAEPLASAVATPPPVEPPRPALPVVQRTEQSEVAPRRLGLGAPILPDSGDARASVPSGVEPGVAVPVPVVEESVTEADAPLAGAVETPVLPTAPSEETSAREPVAEALPRPVVSPAASVETPTQAPSSPSLTSTPTTFQRSVVEPALELLSPKHQDAPQPVRRLQDGSPGEPAADARISVSRAVEPPPSLPTVASSPGITVRSLEPPRNSSGTPEISEPPGSPGGSASAPPASMVSTPLLPVARVVGAAAAWPVPAAVTQPSGTLPPSRPTLTVGTASMSGSGAATPLPELAVSRVIEAPRITSPLPSVRVVDGATPRTVQRADEPSPLVSATLAAEPGTMSQVAPRKDGEAFRLPTAALPVARSADGVEPAPYSPKPDSGTLMSAERSVPLPVARMAEAGNHPKSTMDILRTAQRTGASEPVDHGTGFVPNQPPVVISRQAETPVVQRVPEAPPPEPAAPPVEAQVPAAPTTGVTAPVPQPETEELVKKLFDPLLRRLKTELRLDRERRGALTDRPH
ncbi:hypothetical protein [Amycolatopsis sp. NPDC057786]|uniref:hypothetical protein n=1 Tax=Amycolatopsis sp. NPDC057786 TaxID=3346250 RepID=UPI00366F6ED4